MKLPTLLTALAFVALALGAAPVAGAVKELPLPVCVYGRGDCIITVVDCVQEPCPPQLNCLVGDRSCFVGVEWVVCVTEPCDPPAVCVNFGARCVAVGLP